MTESLAPDLQGVSAATARLLVTVGGIDDATARRPSRLPGWSVGHVLTHIARNADGMLNLVQWAITGVPSPMYPSAEARAVDIESGSARAAAELVADVRESADRLREALERLEQGGPDALGRLVTFGAPTPGSAPDSPARTLPYARLREVEIHHVDLGLPGYSPSDWPPDFVERTLLWIHGRSGAVDVVGGPAQVLAWRLGRGMSQGVRHLDGSDPGEPPPW